MLHLFEERLAASWPPGRWSDFYVLIAVSGGADSMALLQALSALKATSGGDGKLIVGHFDHGLRAESAEDVAFVGEAATRLGLPFELGKADTAALAAEMGDGIEAAARTQRYAFLQAVAERVGARYVVTAHTADDQAETILHRVLRGTSVAGLGGIRRARTLGPAVTLLRPLLDEPRAALRAYLRDIGQEFREDASNANREFTRNKIRHELLPQLAEQYNPQVVDALLRLGQSARDAHLVIEQRAEVVLERAMTPRTSERGAAVTIDCRMLAAEARHVAREVFVVAWRRHGWPRQAMRFDHWEALAAMALAPADQPPPRRTFPGNILAQKTSERLSLTRL